MKKIIKKLKEIKKEWWDSKEVKKIIQLPTTIEKETSQIIEVNEIDETQAIYAKSSEQFIESAEQGKPVFVSIDFDHCSCHGGFSLPKEWITISKM